MISMRNRMLGGMAAALAFALPATNAFAHAHLETSTPAADAVTAAPAAITLHFTEPLEPRFSGFEVKDAKGAAVKVAAVRTADAATLAAKPDAPLSPGAYIVSWHIVAQDGHRMQGAFSFTVKP